MAVRQAASEQTIVETFQRGFVRDLPANVIPAGGVYDATDFLFDQPGKAYKRGGTSAHSAAMGGNGRTPFIIDPPCKILCLAADKHVYDVTSEASPGAIDLGSIGIDCSENPPIYNGIVVITDALAYGSGVGVAPKKAYWDWAGSASHVGTLGGSPPVAWRSTVHAGRLLLARNFTYPSRIWFGPIPNVEATWDTTAAYIDTSWEITGLASTQGVLLVFSSHAIERILGDIPPGTDVTDENMQLQPLASIGCSDARSIVHFEGGVIFGNPLGLFATNSAGIQCLTERSDGTGIGTYWRSLFSASDETGIACGMLGRDHVKVDLFKTSDFSSIASLLLYLPTQAWTRISNFYGVGYAAGNSPANRPIGELYAAQGNKTTTYRLSSFLSPSSSVKNDADGTAVQPTMRLRTLQGSPFLKAWGHGGITMDMRDAASDNPTLAVTVYKGIDQADSKTVPQSPLAETTKARRQEIHVNTDSPGISLNLAQTNASSKTEIFMVDLDVRDYPAPAQRLDQ